MAIFTISRVKNLSTAGPCANLRFREETKGNFKQEKETWLILPVVICLCQRLSNAGVARSLDLGKVFGLLLFSSKSKIWAWPAADKLFIRGNAKAGIRAPNVEIWPLAFQSPR